MTSFPFFVQMGLSGTHNDLFQRMSDRLASYQMTLDQSVYGSFARAREIFFDTIDETTRLPVIVIITLCLLSTMLAFLAAMLTCFMFGCISKDTCIAILKTIFAPCLWSVRFVSWLRSCCGSEDTSTSDMGTTSDTGDDGEESGGDIDGGAGGDAGGGELRQGPGYSYKATGARPKSTISHQTEKKQTEKKKSKERPKTAPKGR